MFLVLAVEVLRRLPEPLGAGVGLEVVGFRQATTQALQPMQTVAS